MGATVHGLDTNGERFSFQRANQPEIHSRHQMTRKQQTAAELMARLAREPAFAANKQRKEVEEQRTLAMLKEEEQPLIADLKAVGVIVETVWDFVNTSASYRVAIPTLVRHLSMPYSLR